MALVRQAWASDGDLLDDLAATDHIHGDPGIEIGTEGTALVYRWEAPSGAEPGLQEERWGQSGKTRQLSSVLLIRCRA
jgi:hypothetical protein